MAWPRVREVRFQDKNIKLARYSNLPTAKISGTLTGSHYSKIGVEKCYWYWRGGLVTNNTSTTSVQTSEVEITLKPATI
jgi:hypothetical protein